MKTKFKTKVLSLLLAVFMLLPTMSVMIPAYAEDITTYILDPGTMADVSGNKPEGATDTAGTDNFFTVHYKAKTKIESNSKDFLGFSSTKRIDFQEPKFKIEIALNKPLNVQVDISPDVKALITSTIAVLSVDTAKNKAGKIANGNKYMKFLKPYLLDCSVYFICIYLTVTL